MKILVYNYENQFALSRGQVQRIATVLPKEYFAPISEFHLTYNTSKPSVFEYSYETKQAFFAFPIKEKTPEVLTKAVEELLVGIARIKEKSRFGEPLKARERAEYQSFVDKWRDKCLNALKAEKA
jgi:hypothetical protein